MTKQSPCAGCGTTPTSHLHEKVSAIAERYVSPLCRPMEWLYRTLLPAIRLLHPERAGIAAAELLRRGGLIDITDTPTNHDSMRTQCLWEAAQKRNITLREILITGKPTDIFIAQYGGQTKIFEGLPRRNGLTSSAIAWMDDKGIMRRKFQAAGIPVSRGGVSSSVSSASRLFHELHPPVITKPNLGSRSRHTTIDVSTADELVSAFELAKELSPWVVIEEQLVGSLYRATVIDGKTVAVMRRDPPQVVGTGTATIQKLIARANRDPRRGNGIFHEIAEGEETRAYLHRQHTDFSSVPRRGQCVPLSPKTSRSVGGTTVDVTDETHPDTIKLFERAGAVLADPLVGIDFIVKDIRLPWRIQERCGVIECNSLPFIDLHHYPFEGKVRDVAGALWESVFPASRYEVFS